MIPSLIPSAGVCPICVGYLWSDVTKDYSVTFHFNANQYFISSSGLYFDDGWILKVMAIIIYTKYFDKRIVQQLKVLAYGVNFFSSTLLLFDNFAYSKYILPERSSNEEYIKHHKSTLTAGCQNFWVKTSKTALVSTFMERGPSNFTNLEKR